MTSLSESHVGIGLLVLGDALESKSNLHAFAECCQAPSHRFFGDQRQKILSFAVDAMERGEIPHDQGAAMEYLSRIRWQDALDALKGKPLVLTAGQDVGETAMVGIQCAALLSDAAGARLTGSGLTYGPPMRAARMLRHLADRVMLLDKLALTSSALAKVSVTEDATPIITGLADLLRDSGTTAGERSIGEALTSALGVAAREAELRAKGQGNPATWGIPSLDQSLPLRKGRFYVVGGRPGGGKTSLAIQAAHVTAKRLGRRSVAYLSLEMSSEELSLVLACRDAKVPRTQAQESWETLLEADRQALHELATAWGASGSMWLRDSSAGPQTVAHVGAWIRSQRSRHGALELVVVDYLGLIKGSNPKQFLIDRVSEITATLKQIALAEGVAIILLSQLTREGRKPPRSADGKMEADPVPRVEDLYGGGSIESDADGVVMLHPIEREGAERRIDAIIAKNRRGPFPVTLPLWFFGQWQHFQDVQAPAASERAARKASTPAPSEGDPWN